jgi:hypothetical protein
LYVVCHGTNPATAPAKYLPLAHFAARAFTGVTLCLSAKDWQTSSASDLFERRFMKLSE